MHRPTLSHISVTVLFFRLPASPSYSFAQQRHHHTLLYTSITIIINNHIPLALKSYSSLFISIFTHTDINSLTHSFTLLYSTEVHNYINKNRITGPQATKQKSIVTALWIRHSSNRPLYCTPAIPKYTKGRIINEYNNIKNKKFKSIY